MLSINRLGYVYGRLTVIQKTNKRQANNIVWLCQCECGNFVEVNGNNLARGNTTSCGCFARENTSKIKSNSYTKGFNAILNHYKHKASERGYSFQLTHEQAYYLMKQPCYYCGIEPNTIRHFKAFNETFIYNGIDRVDNAIGYIWKNCVACCTWCNQAKSSKSKSDFLAWVERLYNNRGNW